MKNIHLTFGVLILILLFSACSMGQNSELKKSSRSVSDFNRSFISVDTPRIALINAKVIDGTGKPIKESQTVLIDNDLIIEVGETDKIDIPEGFFIIDLKNKTLIPGIIGTHNHMRVPEAAMLSTSPKLYLACGVTTIQTCGTGNPYEELAIAKSIKKGEQPGPEIINSSPYFTGPDGKSNFIRFTDEKMVRDTITYWADQGVKWIKVYRKTRPQDLKVIIDEAHKHDIKVTGHLCATTYTEAAELGIDAIEHGFIHSYDHAEGKEISTCSGNTDFRTTLNIDNEAVKKVQQTLIKHDVALSSTLSIYEVQAMVKADPRDLEAMTPSLAEAYFNRAKRKQEVGSDWYFKEDWLKKSMQYDLQFFKQGGLLVAGPDPGLHNMPGYGDQKNYELFIQAGFSAEEAIQVMTSNGAKLLNKKNLGTIQKGKTANLVVLNGDLEKDASVIRDVEIVFKNGIGYDPLKLIEAVKGNVGSQTDNSMTYFGQKEPSNKPELFAPNFISMPNRYEFGCSFSKGGKEFFFGVDDGEQAQIYFSRLKSGVWSIPEKLFKNDSFSANDPMLSPDENRLYFISDRPSKSSGNKNNYDIWYSERAGLGWSEPINAGTSINSSENEYFVSITDSGTMYYSSNTEAESGKENNFDIFSSEFQNGKYLKPVKLPKEINTNRYEADVFIAPDESYIIFCAKRAGGYGNGDLYISFKNKDGIWSPSKNMGPSINTKNHELCPFVSKDGKFLFFTSNKDIYWVSSEIIDQYKEKSR